MVLRLLCINPGSTSTKIAVFSNDRMDFNANIIHTHSDLEAFSSIQEQLGYRYRLISDTLKANDIEMYGLDAVIGRGGAIPFKEGGIFNVTPDMIEACKSGRYADHPSNLGCQLAKIFADEYGIPCFVVDPPLIDEFDEVAYLSGWPGIRRRSAFHALNEKYVAKCIAKALGKRYDEVNIITAHLGSGISVTVHRSGKCVDNPYGSGGDGPFSPERCGRLPSQELLRVLEGSDMTASEWKNTFVKKSGVYSYFGTNDMIELEQRALSGDLPVKTVIDGMAHLVAKEVAAYCTIVDWKVDGIGITGAIAKSSYITSRLIKELTFIAPVTLFPGEYEMQALAEGGCRVLRNEETPKKY